MLWMSFQVLMSVDTLVALQDTREVVAKISEEASA